MSRFEHILLYDLRDSIEGGVGAFYFLIRGLKKEHMTTKSDFGASPILIGL